ncbi:hypothetical protein EV361DRAFT_867153 [Lentinula raphanica]|nr:hypothetical protein EV361DRAFT_867153 [Lentinula raphanica]
MTRLTLRTTVLLLGAIPFGVLAALTTISTPPSKVLLTGEVQTFRQYGSDLPELGASPTAAPVLRARFWPFKKKVGKLSQFPETIGVRICFPFERSLAILMSPASSQSEQARELNETDKDLIRETNELIYQLNREVAECTCDLLTKLELLLKAETDWARLNELRRLLNLFTQLQENYGSEFPNGVVDKLREKVTLLVLASVLWSLEACESQRVSMESTGSEYYYLCEDGAGRR